jgi:hypothetical protein
VLPAQSYQTPLGTSPAGTPAPDLPSVSTRVNRLDIPGHRDVAIKKYSNWQQSQVNDKILKVEFQKACDVTLADGLDLEQIYQDQDPEFFIEKGIKRGIARRFVGDINQWVKSCKEAGTGEWLE